MDTVARFEPRRIDQAAETVLQPDPKQQLAVTATYHLSEEGRKASLLSGGNGRALQEVTIQVPANRLHLVAVDANGRAARQIASLWSVIEQQLALDCDASSAHQPARRKA